MARAVALPRVAPKCPLWCAVLDNGASALFGFAIDQPSHRRIIVGAQHADHVDRCGARRTQTESRAALEAWALYRADRDRNRIGSARLLPADVTSEPATTNATSAHTANYRQPSHRRTMTAPTNPRRRRPELGEQWSRLRRPRRRRRKPHGSLAVSHPRSVSMKWSLVFANQ